jgi:hypothetical protein
VVGVAGIVVVGVAGVVVELVSVVVVVVDSSPLSLLPHPTARASRVAPPNNASAVLGWDLMFHLTVGVVPRRYPTARMAKLTRHA